MKKYYLVLMMVLVLPSMASNREVFLASCEAHGVSDGVPKEEMEVYLEICSCFADDIEHRLGSDFFAKLKLVEGDELGEITDEEAEVLAEIRKFCVIAGVAKLKKVSN